MIDGYSHCGISKYRPVEDVLAAFHFWHYAATFPSLSDALTTLVPALMMALIGPASWVEYFLVFRVYRAWRAVSSAALAAKHSSPEE